MASPTAVSRRPRKRRASEAEAAPTPQPLKDWSNLDPNDLSSPALYINRELSWLAFNERVLAQAQDSSHPLLERVKFLAITGTNLDEFFMVRVATILKKFRADIDDVSIDGQNTDQQLATIRSRALAQIDEQTACWSQSLRPLLAAEGIHFLEPADYTPAIDAWLTQYFKDHIFPVLTPLAFDPGHPFPYISNLSMNLAVRVRHAGRTKFARVKVPGMLPRFIALPDNLSPQPGVSHCFLEDVIRRNIQQLFPGTQVEGAHLFRIIRDTDMVIQEDEADDLLETVDRGLKQLRYGALSLLQVEADMPKRVLSILIENFEVDEDVVVRTADRLGFGDWHALTKLHRPALKYPAFQPRTLWAPDETDKVFEQIADQDFLIHHPFDSFTSIETFLRAAVDDPHVVTIKITLYRIGPNSPLVDLLIEAAEQGKQVAVLVELKARFDERNNIAWATRLEAAGIHVVYGLMNLKVHCKLCLVVRQEADGIHRYAHVSTGNYNRVTSQVYTDLGLFTADEAVLDDITEVFNSLTGYSNRRSYNALLVAPVGLRQGFRALVEREIEHAKAGPPGADHHQEQRRRRPRHDQDPLSRLAGRRADRHDRARRVLPAPGHSGHQRSHPGAIDRRAVPRALAHLLLRERRRARGVYRQRRPDGAQSRSPRRSAVPGPRSGDATAAPRCRARGVAERHRPRLDAADRRQLYPRHRAAGRPAAQFAAVPAGVVRGPARDLI